MINSLAYLLCRVLLGVLIGGSRHRSCSDLQIVVLRHQLKVFKRQNPKPKITGFDRALLAAAARRLTKPSRSILIVTPRTLQRWHQKLVAYKWARYSRRARRRGRPPLSPEMQELILRLAKENERWGYRRVHGEPSKLGVTVSATAVRILLRRRGFGPASTDAMSSWARFLSTQAKTILACDFFTVETLFLKRIYVLFFIEVASRRVYYAGCTAKPDGGWVTQQARNLFMSEKPLELKFLIHDRDSKCCGPFDEIFLSEGYEIVKTPYRSPQANAFAERWVKSVRSECLDHLFVLSRRHLEHLVQTYVEHYNSHRPHWSLENRSPNGIEPEVASVTDLVVARRDRLGGLIHEYYSEAA